jgi:hypothetical protein
MPDFRAAATAVFSTLFLMALGGFVSANVRVFLQRNGWDNFLLRLWEVLPTWSQRMWLTLGPIRSRWWLWLALGASSGIALSPWLGTHTEVTRYAPESPRGPEAAQQVDPPISWDYRIFLSSWSGGQEKENSPYIWILRISGRVSGSASVQMKGAYIESELTGERRSLNISTRPGYLTAETLPVNEVNPIPPSAQIWLMTEWKPPISATEFYREWGKLTLHIEYADVVINKDYSEEQVKSIMAQDLPGADLLLGTPRVTKKVDQ